MKKKSARLRPVKEMAENNAKQAVSEMVSARNSHQTHEQKLQELISYRLEYIEQFQFRAKKGMQSSQLQQYQLFINQLDEAIQHQRMTVLRSGEKLDDRKNHWRNKDSHKRAINKAVNRFKRKENRISDKVEQDNLDEHNTRVYNENNVEKQ
ncbi:MAG: flagellar export protein FliJ [Gammaproteobacteria bacterium]|nr:flagellar export protein FliJ [Gammaproteobacteria bacterium]